MVTSEQVLETLRQFKEESGKEFGIELIGIFGSVARGTASDDSDVDVVVRMTKPNLFKLSRLRIELEERVNQHVDIVSYRPRMNAYLKERIDQEACYV
ncbi:MAG: nucleotidyltransferase domain-containing protein [Kiritimatiellae bacterium]|jgi:predicted nucleotidyltransferase|nr:nucleotidyltransferase domain-containing protein [Kiritimatiellia bacterium]